MKGMMVNFMCQLDWATGCSDIQLNTITVYDMKLFLEEIGF